jgi:cell wall-associated NlpC family hydrolase
LGDIAVMRCNSLLGAIFIPCALIAQPGFAAQFRVTPAPSERNVQTTAGAEDSVRKLIDNALNLVGVRYRYGGGDAGTGFDCSGLVEYVFRASLGLELPRTAREISGTGVKVRRTELEPGDLVFFHTGERFSHVGIYLGDHLFVHASRTGKSVRVSDLRHDYWARRYGGARRIDGS